MENRITCATFTTGSFGNSNGYMCKHCSGVQFDAEKNQYWKCKKYNVKLSENEDKYLVRCSKCLEFGDEE